MAGGLKLGSLRILDDTDNNNSDICVLFIIYLLV